MSGKRKRDSPKLVELSDKSKWKKTKANPHDDFRTPAHIMDDLAKEWPRPTLDVAANEENAVAEHFYTKEDNALEQEWNGVVWCNPPYIGISDWYQKAKEEILHNPKCEEIQFLGPASTYQAIFHHIIMPLASEVVFYRGRIAFLGPHSLKTDTGRQLPAAFGSMAVRFVKGGRPQGQPLKVSSAWAYPL